ncbi:hypothetical protein ETW24_15465 [Leisingera sp. NJS204]|nr:hypothetical protein ETW24_15465 [Leisingera sp. NJS204]
MERQAMRPLLLRPSTWMHPGAACLDTAFAFYVRQFELLADLCRSSFYLPARKGNSPAGAPETLTVAMITEAGPVIRAAFEVKIVL